MKSKGHFISFQRIFGLIIAVVLEMACITKLFPQMCVMVTDVKCIYKISNNLAL